MGITGYLMNLFFPPRCASCKEEGDFLCKKCVQSFRLTALKAKSLHPSIDDFEYLDGVIYGADYAENPQLKAAIAQFKYKFTRELVTEFGRLVSGKMKELGMLKEKQAALIPVPLHRKRLNERGFNQAELIARTAADLFGSSAGVYTVLKRVKNTAQQARLCKEERRANLAGAFEMTGDPGSLAGRICFVVDDVCTTGATLDNCARVLKDKGVRKVYGLVVCRAFK